MRFENPIGRDKYTAPVVVDLAALTLIHRALNEVCNGGLIDDLEFETRVGAPRAEARALLKSVDSLLTDFADLD